jgi:phenylalanyl-tRNA synthetase beta chain
VSAPDLCGRFSGRVVRNVDPKAANTAMDGGPPGALWPAQRDALVDISNYVMFEYGRPSHIFDLDKIHGGLDVRWGKPGEQLKLLNGNTVTVDDKVGVIADDLQVESLAGIMGGDATAVSDDTRMSTWRLLLVAEGSGRAFAPLQLCHRCRPPLRARCRPQPDGRAYRAHHAADHRHLRHAETPCGPVDDQKVNLPVCKPVQLRVARAAKVIGMPLTTRRLPCLTRLGLPVGRTGYAAGGAGVLA